MGLKLYELSKNDSAFSFVYVKPLTDEEIKILLEEATKTKEFKKTLKIMREN